MREADYKEMIVNELREESRNRGMTLQHKGKKFTKSQLIERLLENDREMESVKVKEKKLVEKKEPEKKESVSDCFFASKRRSEYVGIFAKTLEEIENKYTYRREQKVYDHYLQKGSKVVFVQYLKTKSGHYIKKLRKGYVDSVDRENEKVTVHYYEKVFVLRYHELLYIMENGSDRLPPDIRQYIKNEYEKRWKRNEKNG